MAFDYDIGSGSLSVSTKRFIHAVSIYRDANKLEKGEVLVIETKTEVDSNGNEVSIISTRPITVTLTDAVLKSLPGHNLFLGNVRDLANTMVTQFKAGNTVESVTGSIAM